MLPILPIRVCDWRMNSCGCFDTLQFGGNIGNISYLGFVLCFLFILIMLCYRVLVVFIFAPIIRILYLYPTVILL